MNSSSKFSMFVFKVVGFVLIGALVVYFDLLADLSMQVTQLTNMLVNASHALGF